MLPLSFLHLPEIEHRTNVSSGSAMVFGLSNRTKSFGLNISYKVNARSYAYKIEAYSLSSYQVHGTVMIMSQMAMGLHIVCATFISLGILGALLVRMHERIFFRMVAAELQRRFSQQIITPVFCTQQCS